MLGSWNIMIPEKYTILFGSGELFRRRVTEYIFEIENFLCYIPRNHVIMMPFQRQQLEVKLRGLIYARFPVSEFFKLKDSIQQ
jgi:hypothetical protein